eukprot:8386023-Alexandrium_andersonii.AAC.1
MCIRDRLFTAPSCARSREGKWSTWAGSGSNAPEADPLGEESASRSLAAFSSLSSAAIWDCCFKMAFRSSSFG